MTFTVTNSNHECLLWEILDQHIEDHALCFSYEYKKNEKQGLYFVGMFGPKTHKKNRSRCLWTYFTLKIFFPVIYMF